MVAANTAPMCANTCLGLAEIAHCARASRLRCLRRRKREPQHHVSTAKPRFEISFSNYCVTCSPSLTIRLIKSAVWRCSRTNAGPNHRQSSTCSLTQSLALWVSGLMSVSVLCGTTQMSVLQAGVFIASNSGKIRPDYSGEKHYHNDGRAATTSQLRSDAIECAVC